MEVFDIVTTKKFDSLFENNIAKGSLTYKADKGKVLVFMFMGTEDEASDGQKINGDELFDQMGWERKKNEAKDF